jgi:hypothetical protein
MNNTMFYFSIDIVSLAVQGGVGTGFIVAKGGTGMYNTLCVLVVK